MGLAILVAMALQAADLPQQLYEVEFAPLLPSERRFAYVGPAGPYYPERAFRNHQNGEGRLRCVVGAQGSLQQCVPFAEGPTGYGFADAARILAERRRVRVTGAASEGESVMVRVPFVIGAPATVIERSARTSTVKVSAPGVRGHAEVACVVVDKGLDRCHVLSFQSMSGRPATLAAARAEMANDANAALAAVAQVSTDRLEKDGWVVIPMDLTPTATPGP